jgi:RimJ/RimL family protein N-acetyltransferase
MCLSIVPKSELSDEQLRWIEERLSAPENLEDSGPPKVWRTYQNGVFAVIQVTSNKPIGLVEASGDKACVSPGWWVDKAFREKGYGYKLVDTLAEYLKTQGLTGAGKPTIQTTGHEYDIASKKLADRFQSHFQQT